MPIEEVVLNKVSLASKLLQREDFWIRELGSIYPNGLNDNVKGLGNISTLVDKDNLIVYSLFHKHKRKYRNRSEHKNSSKVYNELIDNDLSLGTYMSGSCTRDLRTYVFGLPRRKLREVLRVLNDYLSREALPGRIAVLSEN